MLRPMSEFPVWVANHRGFALDGLWLPIHLADDDHSIATGWDAVPIEVAREAGMLPGPGEEVDALMEWRRLVQSIRHTEGDT